MSPGAPIHETALALSLVLMALVVACFAWVSASAARGTGDDHAAHAYCWRDRVFWLVLLAGLAIALATLSPWPIAGHARQAASPEVTVRAVAHQWRWEIARDTVPAGKDIEFEITASDVNHGFGLYRNGRLIAQAQAMPGYVNRLRVRLAEPGEYELLCLEYCGVAHHGMRAVIRAVPSS